MTRSKNWQTGEPALDLELARMRVISQEAIVASLEAQLECMQRMTPQQTTKELKQMLRVAKRRLELLEQQAREAGAAVMEEQMRRNLFLTVAELADTLSPGRVFDAIKPLEAEAELKKATKNGHAG